MLRDEARLSGQRNKNFTARVPFQAEKHGAGTQPRPGSLPSPTTAPLGQVGQQNQQANQRGNQPDCGCQGQQPALTPKDGRPSPRRAQRSTRDDSAGPKPGTAESVPEVTSTSRAVPACPRAAPPTARAALRTLHRVNPARGAAKTGRRRARVTVKVIQMRYDVVRAAQALRNNAR